MRHIRRFLHVGIHPVSVDAENIKSVDSKPKFSLVTVDHHNVIIIRRKLTGQFISDFPITYNHNLHSLSL